jgi:hypothetical protein
MPLGKEKAPAKASRATAGKMALTLFNRGLFIASPVRQK